MIKINLIKGLEKKKCKGICKKWKELKDFSKKKSGKYGVGAKCKKCQSEYQKQYYKNNEEEIKKYLKEYHKKYNQSKRGKETRQRGGRKYLQTEKGKKKHREKEKRYNQSLKGKNTISNRNKNKRKKDFIFKLRCYVSSSIWLGLKKQNSVKNHSTWKAIKEYCGYTPDDLRQHLEEQIIILGKSDEFTLENHGSVWEIHHIIQQKDLPYDSFEHSNFAKCWDLYNLIPLSIKEHKERHKKDK